MNERNNEAIIPHAAKTRLSQYLNKATSLARKSTKRYRRINISIARNFGTMFEESVIGAIRELFVVSSCRIGKQVSIRTKGSAIRRDCTCTAGARLLHELLTMIIKRLIANLRDYPEMRVDDPDLPNDDYSNDQFSNRATLSTPINRNFLFLFKFLFFTEIYIDNVCCVQAHTQVKNNIYCLLYFCFSFVLILIPFKLTRFN